MCLLSDRDIEFYANNRDMIEPFVPEQIRIHDTDFTKRAVSWGLSSYGYDIRLAREFMIFSEADGAVIDPLNFDGDKFIIHHIGSYVDIPPHGFVLARSEEYFIMPPNVEGIVHGKSTYARCGVVTPATPLEPAWEGHITLEFGNLTPLPIRMWAGMGCAQVLFFEGKNQCRTTYADRAGKYMKQTGITLPRT